MYKNDDGKLEKKEYDPQLLTAIDNTIKFVRFARCKNENLHAGLKKKFHLLDSKIELTYLEPLYPDKNLSKYTALSTICCGLFNQEHPGYPVRFLKEDSIKVWKANQILENFNIENFLQHIDVLKFKGWKEIGQEKDLSRKHNFPLLPPEKFDQIIEVTGGIHCLRKGLSVSCNLLFFILV